MDLVKRLDEARLAVRGVSKLIPEMGVILGSGLGAFAETLEVDARIPYGEIPHFEESRVPGHAGELVLGHLKGRSLAVLKGRYHFYEGHAMDAVCFPTRLLGRLGAKGVVITNAAGGVNPSFEAGDLMVIRDHINLMGANPLRGDNDQEVGPRFPDMSGIYDPEGVRIAEEGLASLGCTPRSGVYAAMPGPSYETPAEVAMLGRLGVDAVGMSTVPEAIAARHMGMKVIGISCITNKAAGLSPIPLSHDEVEAAARAARATFMALVEKIVTDTIF